MNTTMLMLVILVILLIFTNNTVNALYQILCDTTIMKNANPTWRSCNELLDTTPNGFPRSRGFVSLPGSGTCDGPAADYNPILHTACVDLSNNQQIPVAWSNCQDPFSYPNNPTEWNRGVVGDIMELYSTDIKPILYALNANTNILPIKFPLYCPTSKHNYLCSAPNPGAETWQQCNLPTQCAHARFIQCKQDYIIGNIGLTNNGSGELDQYPNEAIRSFEDCATSQNVNGRDGLTSNEILKVQDETILQTITPILSQETTCQYHYVCQRYDAGGKAVVEDPEPCDIHHIINTNQPCLEMLSGENESLYNPSVNIICTAISDETYQPVAMNNCERLTDHIVAPGFIKNINWQSKMINWWQSLANDHTTVNPVSIGDACMRGDPQIQCENTNDNKPSSLCVLPTITDPQQQQCEQLERIITCRSVKSYGSGNPGVPPGYFENDELELEVCYKDNQPYITGWTGLTNTEQIQFQMNLQQVQITVEEVICQKEYNYYWLPMLPSISSPDISTIVIPGMMISENDILISTKTNPTQITTLSLNDDYNCNTPKIWSKVCIETSPYIDPNNNNNNNNNNILLNYYAREPSYCDNTNTQTDIIIEQIYIKPKCTILCPAIWPNGITSSNIGQQITTTELELFHENEINCQYPYSTIKWPDPTQITPCTSAWGPIINQQSGCLLQLAVYQDDGFITPLPDNESKPKFWTFGQNCHRDGVIPPDLNLVLEYQIQLEGDCDVTCATLHTIPETILTCNDQQSELWTIPVPNTQCDVEINYRAKCEFTLSNGMNRNFAQGLGLNIIYPTDDFNWCNNEFDMSQLDGLYNTTAPIDKTTIPGAIIQQYTKPGNNCGSYQTICKSSSWTNLNLDIGDVIDITTIPNGLTSCQELTYFEYQTWHDNSQNQADVEGSSWHYNILPKDTCNNNVIIAETFPQCIKISNNPITNAVEYTIALNTDCPTLTWPIQLKANCETTKFGCAIAKDDYIPINTKVDFTCDTTFWTKTDHPNESCLTDYTRAVLCLIEYDYSIFATNIIDQTSSNNGNKITTAGKRTLCSTTTIPPLLEDGELEMLNDNLNNNYDYGFTYQKTIFDNTKCNRQYNWLCGELTTTSADIGDIITDNEFTNNLASCNAITLDDWVHNDYSTKTWKIPPTNWKGCLKQGTTTFEHVNGIDEVGEIYLAKQTPICIEILNNNYITPGQTITTRTIANTIECETTTGTLLNDIQTSLKTSCEYKNGCTSTSNINTNLDQEFDEICDSLWNLANSQCYAELSCTVRCATIIDLSSVVDNNYNQDLKYDLNTPLSRCGIFSAFQTLLIDNNATDDIQEEYILSTNNIQSQTSSYTFSIKDQQDSCTWSWKCGLNPDPTDPTSIGTCDVNTNIEMATNLCTQQCNQPWTSYGRCVANKPKSDGTLEFTEINDSVNKCGEFPSSTATCTCTTQCTADATLSNAVWSSCDVDENNFKIATTCGGINTRDVKMITTLGEYTYNQCKVGGEYHSLCGDLIKDIIITQYQNEQQIEQTCTNNIKSVCANPNTLVDDVDGWADCNIINSNTNELWGWDKTRCIGCGIDYNNIRDVQCIIDIVDENIPINTLQEQINTYYTQLPAEQRDLMYQTINNTICPNVLDLITIIKPCECTIEYLCYKDPTTEPLTTSTPDNDINKYGSCGESTLDNQNDDFLYGFTTCPILCNIDQRIIKRNIYCRDKDGIIKYINEDSRGACEVLDETTHPFPITTKTCQGNISCKAMFLCNNYQTTDLYTHNTVNDDAICTTNNFWSDICFIDQNNAFVEERCILDDDQRIFYRLRDVQCLTYDGDLSIDGKYTALPTELILPDNISNNNNNQQQQQEQEFCQYLAIQQQGITQPLTSIRDITLNQKCIDTTGCTITNFNLNVDFPFYSEGDKIIFTWNYQGVARNEDKLYLEYAVSTSNNPDSGLLEWIVLPLPQGVADEGLLLSTKQYRWTIPINFTANVITKEPIYIRATVPTIPDLQTIYAGIAGIANGSNNNNDNNNNNNNNINNARSILINRITSCAHHECIGPNVDSCIMLPLLGGNNQQQPICQCAVSLDNQYRFEPNPPKGYGHCERNGKCDAINDCENDGYYAFDSTIKYEPLQCAKACTCPYGHKSIDKCTTCTTPCKTTQGRADIQRGTGGSCYCEQCYLGFWGQHCDRCTNYIQLNITHPSNDIYNIFNAINNDDTAEWYGTTIFTKRLFQTLSTTINFPFTNIILNRDFSSINHQYDNINNINITIVSLIIELRGRCDNNNNNNNNNTQQMNILSALTSTTDENVPYLPQITNIGTITSSIIATQNVWNVAATVNSEIFIDLNIKQYLPEIIELDCPTVFNNFNGLDYDHPKCKRTDRPSIDDTKPSKKKTTVMILAIVIPLVIIVIALIIVIMAVCMHKRSKETQANNNSNANASNNNNNNNTTANDNKKPKKPTRGPQQHVDDSLELV